MADRYAPDLSRMKNLIGKSWNSWNLPEAATEYDLKQMRAQFKPKESKIPLEHTNPLPTELMYLYGSRPEFDWFSLTQCPACKKYFKTQWLNNHFIKNTANEHLCKTTGIVVGLNQMKKKKIPKRSHESRHHSRYRSSHDHHRHRSKKSHHTHSSSKSKRSSLTYVSDLKKHKDRLSSPSKPKAKEKIIDDPKRYNKEKSNKRHSSPKDRRASNPTSYTLSIPDDKDENIPVKVLLSNKKSSKHEKPSLQIISEKPTKISKSVSNEKLKVHKESNEKKGKSVSGSAHSIHKHKKTSSHGNSEHSPSPTKTNLKDDYKFKIPLKSKSSDSRSQVQSFDSSKSTSKDSSKYKMHNSAETPKVNDVTASPKVAYRSTSNILSNSNIPNKHSSANTIASSLKISLQNISPSTKVPESESTVTAKGISSKSHAKEKNSSTAAVLSPKHSTSSSKGTTLSKSTSSSSKSTPSNSSNKSPSSNSSSKSNVTILNSKLALSLLSPDSKLQSMSKSSSTSVKQSAPVAVSKLSSSKSGASLSRSSSSVKSSSSSSSSTSKSSSLSPSKPATVSSASKSNSKALSPRSSPISVSKSPSSSGKSSSSTSSSKTSSVLPSAKLPVTTSPSSKSSIKSQSISSKSSKSQPPPLKPTPCSNIIMTSSSVKPGACNLNSSLSSSSESLLSYDVDAPYYKEIKISSSLSTKTYGEVSGKYFSPVSSKDKKSSKSSSSVAVESIPSKPVTSSKDKKHSGKHASGSSHTSLTTESKPLYVVDKPSSKDKKSTSKSSTSAPTSSEVKTAKTTPPVTKKSSVYQSSLSSPTSYKSVSPPSSSSFPSALPPAYIAPSWTSAFKSSIAQTLTSAAKSPLPSTIQSSSSCSLPLKNSFASVVHKSPMIASTSSAIQSTIVAASTLSPTLLAEQLGTKAHTFGSATFVHAGGSTPEPIIKIEKPEPKQSHHSKKKKKKKDKDETRKIIPLKDRCFHPDQHCGVVVAPSVMPCKRSLTCKTHSIASRRAVAGRSSSFDSLLAAHKKARDEEKLNKNEKRDVVITPEITESMEIPVPSVESPVMNVSVAKPYEAPVVAPPVVSTVVLEPPHTPQEVYITDSVSDTKENTLPDQEESEEEVTEVEPDVIVVKDIPVVVIDPQEVQDGTSLFEVSRADQERSFNIMKNSFKCLTNKQFGKTCRALKRQIVEVADEECVYICTKKTLLDANVNEADPKRKEFNFVALRGEEEIQILDPITGEPEPTQEGEVTILRTKSAPKIQTTDEKKNRLVTGKSVYRAVNSLRNRQAARRITAINQALYADNCVSHKAYLISKQTEMAKLALRANDVERAKRHLTVKKIMSAKDSLSFTAQRVAKWLVRSKLGLVKQGSMFASSHSLVEKCLLDRKHFLTKQYILIRKQLQTRERVKARKRVMKCYSQAVKRSLLINKNKLRINQKLVTDKQKKLDKHFRLNVYRNLKRIRKYLLKKQLKVLRLALIRNARYSRQKSLARKLSKRKKSPLLNSNKQVSLVQSRMVTRKFLLNQKNSLKRNLVRQNYIKIVKPCDKIVSQEKLRTCDVGQKSSLGSQLLLRSKKPRVISVLMPMSKKNVPAILKQPTSNSKDTLNGETNNIQNVNPSDFKSLIGSRLGKGKKVSSNVTPVTNTVLGVGQNKSLLAGQTGQNILHNQLITALDILAFHRTNADLRKKKILLGQSCKVDEQNLSVFRPTLMISKSVSRSEFPAITNKKGENSLTLANNSNQKINFDSRSTAISDKQTKSSVDCSLPQRNSISTPSNNLKGQNYKIDQNRSSRTIAEGNKKGAQMDVSATTQSVPLCKSKSVGKSTGLTTPSPSANANQNSATVVKSKGKGSDVSGSQKCITMPGSLVGEKIPPRSRLCKYRVVSQTILQKPDSFNGIPNNKNVVPGTKLAPATNIKGENTVISKSQLKNNKVAAVKKLILDSRRTVQASDLNVSGHRPTRPDSQPPSRGSQNKIGIHLLDSKGSETNSLYSNLLNTQGAKNNQKYLAVTPRILVTTDGKQPRLGITKPNTNEDIDSQRKFLVTLLAVQQLLNQKRITGDKHFSEQESKLIKHYLKCQSSKNKNNLIANCLLTKNSGGQNELFKKVMSGSTKLQ